MDDNLAGSQASQKHIDMIKGYVAFTDSLKSEDMIFAQC